MEIVLLIKAVIASKLNGLFLKITNEFGEEVQQIISNNILEYQIEEYNRNLFSKTLLHRVQPKKLNEFYQPLFIAKCDPKYRNRRFGIEQNLDERIPTNSINELFSDKQYITLIGSAGSGKSTIVKYLFLNAIDNDFKIPIKLELRL